MLGEYRASARREDDVVQSGKLLDHQAFALAKTCLPFDFEDRRDRNPGSFRNLVVGIKTASQGAWPKSDRRSFCLRP